MSKKPSLEPIPSPPGTPAAGTPDVVPNDGKQHVRISHVANIFIKMRRRRTDAVKTKSHHIVSDSDDKPISHPEVAAAVDLKSKTVPVRIERTDSFVCAGGVNAVVLLKATRKDILDTAERMGGTALVEERHVFVSSLVQMLMLCVDGNVQYVGQSIAQMAILRSKSVIPFVSSKPALCPMLFSDKLFCSCGPHVNTRSSQARRPRKCQKRARANDHSQTK
jgi:hypothetical protein